MKLKTVPVEWVHRTWPLVEPMITEALKHSKGEATPTNALQYLSQGQWILIVVVDDDEHIHGAITMEVFNRPDARVAFITSIGGKLISNQDTFAQLKAIAASMGATALEGAARESVARLWSRLGFEEKYRIVGVKL